MRKEVIRPGQEQANTPQHHWLNLDEIAQVEISSEDPAHPVEHAFTSQNNTHWRAGDPGKQNIKLKFDNPQKINFVWLRFVDNQRSRTQEYVLRWSPDNGQTNFEIVRQQWNFSPDGATEETADHHVNLVGVTELELLIEPDISRNDAYATLDDFRLA